MDYFKDMELQHDEVPQETDARVPMVSQIEKSGVVNASGGLANSLTQSTMDSLDHISRTVDSLGPTSISELPTSSVLVANENLSVAAANEGSNHAFQTLDTLREDVHGEIDLLPGHDPLRFAQQMQAPSGSSSTD